MKIRIIKIEIKHYEDTVDLLGQRKHYWEVEYRVQENNASVYLTGNLTFMEGLPSEEEIIRQIKLALMDILKQLL